MTQALDLMPPTEPGEIETITFDYGTGLSAEETIVSVLGITCATVIGSDSPAGKLVGSAAIITSPYSGVASQAVIQQVGSMVGNNTYQFSCLVLTSANQRLRLRSNIRCALVPVGV